MPQRSPAALILCALALACGAEHPTVHVATIGNTFFRGGTGTAAEAVVPYTITNRSDRTVFVPACGSEPEVIVDRGTGASWEQYSGTACLAVYPQTPIELHAGETVTGHVQFVQAGHFRVRASYATGTAAASAEVVASNPFDVR